MTRKLLLLPVFLLSILTSCKQQTAINKEETSPNIVLIIADDMGWDAFGAYPGINSSKASTPTLDSLARNGITFTNFWTNPECSPTRAALMTGKYGFRTGVGSAGGILANSETTIQKYISDQTSNRYSNAVIGKWHVSGGADLAAPERFGVQYFSGILIGMVNDYYNWTQTSNGIQQNITTYATTHFVDQSITWMQQQTKPFFLWLAFNAPHTPFHRPPLDLITDQALSNNPTSIQVNPLPYYLAAIEAMDKEIGRLIASMSAGQRENTIFIVLGDNGTPAQVAQAPFVDKAKSTLFQGGINCPLIVSGIAVKRKNEVETALVQSTDLFPTLAELMGAGSANYQDGKSIRPLFTAASATVRAFAYSELFGGAISRNNGYTLRNERFKYIKLQNGTEQLYRIETDPFETTNLMLTPLDYEAQQNLDALRVIASDL